MKNPALSRIPLLYLITDRRKLAATPSSPDRPLGSFIGAALEAGVDMIQIRERDLSTLDQYSLTRQAVEISSRSGGVVLVNDRADIAAACPGAGVHLTTRSMSVATVRQRFGERMLIGASTHSRAEAERAEQEGADFVVFGPVYETASKKEYGLPVGLDALASVTRNAGIPVLAIGGIDPSRFQEVLDRGASGIAGISLFAEARDLSALVRLAKRTAGR